jgi:hypothetical protein
MPIGSAFPLGNENVYTFLERRERELAAQAAALRGDLFAVERELADVQAARKQMGSPLHAGSASNTFNLTVPTPPVGAGGVVVGPLSNSNLFSPFFAPQANPFHLDLGLTHQPPDLPAFTLTPQPTIKELILKAMDAAFRKDGATPAQLREFIRDAYGREIDRNSLSPQIARLKDEHLIKQKPGEEVWRLTQEGLRRLSRVTLPEVSED